MPDGKDHRNKKIYDVNSDEARKIMAGQKVQGYTPSFGYIEKTNLFELFIPVPKVSAKHVCMICKARWSEPINDAIFFLNVLSCLVAPLRLLFECFPPFGLLLFGGFGRKLERRTWLVISIRIV